jgi:hypothetical protein
MLFHYSLLSFKSILLANAGVPLFSQSVIYQTLLLIPIIAIEAYVHRKLLEISIGKAVWIAFSTNVISTLIGGLFVVLSIGAFLGTVLFGSSVPVQPGSFPFLPLEIIVTLIPLFLFSVVVESFIGSFSLRKIDHKKVRRSFLIANAFTYLMLEILAITQLIKGYIEGRG